MVCAESRVGGTIKSIGCWYLAARGVSYRFYQSRKESPNSVCIQCSRATIKTDAHCVHWVVALLVQETLFVSATAHMASHCRANSTSSLEAACCTVPVHIHLWCRWIRVIVQHRSHINHWPWPFRREKKARHVSRFYSVLILTEPTIHYRCLLVEQTSHDVSAERRTANWLCTTKVGRKAGWIRQFFSLARKVWLLFCRTPERRVLLFVDNASV